MESGTYGFFTPAPLMLAGPGFALFGPEHLAWLAASAALVVIVVRGYLRLPGDTARGGPRRRMMVAVAAVPVALSASQDLVMVRAGVFGAQWWPLHTCNLCEFLALAYALRPSRPVGEILFALGTVGALLALLFPGWTYCPPLTWPVVCGFVEHALIVAFVLMLAVAGDLRPELRRIWQPIAFVIGYLLVFYPFNKAFDTNFGFVNVPQEGSPLAWFAQAFGIPGYLVPFAASILAAWVALYRVWDALERRGVLARWRRRALG